MIIFIFDAKDTGRKCLKNTIIGGRVLIVVAVITGIIFWRRGNRTNSPSNKEIKAARECGNGVAFPKLKRQKTAEVDEAATNVPTQLIPKIPKMVHPLPQTIRREKLTLRRRRRPPSSKHFSDRTSLLHLPINAPRVDAVLNFLHRKNQS